MIRHYRAQRMRQPAQCRCSWCNKWMTSTDDCLSVEQKLALRTFARLQGGHWKSRLAAQWERGKANKTLTDVITIIGVDGLHALKTDMVRDYDPRPKV